MLGYSESAFFPVFVLKIAYRNEYDQCPLCALARLSFCESVEGALITVCNGRLIMLCRRGPARNKRIKSIWKEFKK